MKTSSFLNTPFLRALQELEFPAGCVRKIRLDPDMVGLPETFLETFELAYWRGPKFTDDLTAIPAGVTRHEASDLERTLSGISRTEFWWYELSGRKTFECEELRDEETLGVGAGSFGCRFVHTILSENGLPVHADGAIRMYDEEKMLKRLGNDIAGAGKKTTYTKLWRVDGEIPVRLWKELVAHYYRDNAQIGEYLGGDKEAETPMEAAEEVETAAHSSLPLVLNTADGVHLSAALHRPQEEMSRKTGVKLLAWDSIRSGTEVVRYYEADVLDVLKVIRKTGLKTRIPSDVARVDWRDAIFNLPSLLHYGPGAREAAIATQTICRDMFQRWLAAGSEYAVTVSVGIAYDSATLWLSFAGTLPAMVAWLENPASRPPATLAEMRDWCGNAHKVLREMFPEVQSAPGVDEVCALLRSSGTLRFRRLLISGGEFKIEKDPKGLKILAVPPKGERAEFVARGYRPIAAVALRSSECGTCGKEFSKCPCAGFVEQGGELIRAMDPFCLAWGRPPGP